MTLVTLEKVNMIEELIRNLDPKTTQSLVVTIKSVLSDHVRFIREINRFLIFKDVENTLFTDNNISAHQQNFKSWFESYKGTVIEGSHEINKIADLHLKLQIMAEKITKNLRQFKKIDIIEYELFLNENDHFFEFLWQLATEIISAQYQFDPLTKLLNRRAFLPILQHELSKVNRLDSCCSLVLVDIDDFKDINDNYGHDTGDSILTQFSTMLSKHLRQSDCASRHGGDEFLLCLPDTDVNKAYRIIERLNNHIQAFEYSSNIHLTASFGISPLKKDIRNSIINADVAMYQSKNNGKNQISIFEEHNG